MTKAFARFARKAGLDHAMLRLAIVNVECGLIDADLGGGVIKLRVARPGQGKSGGYRTIVLYRAKHRAVFMYGFAKSDQANIDDDDLACFRQAAAQMLIWSDAQVTRMLAAGAWVEVTATKE
jgi:hypothetical protein